MFSINTVRWSSPLPATSKESGNSVSFTLNEIFLSTSFISLSLKCLDVINLPSLPAKGPLFTLNVIETVGSSISTKSIFSIAFSSHIVSPIFILFIPERVIISPAFPSSTVTLFNPWYTSIFVIVAFSILSSLLQIATCIPFLIVPLSTLPTAILPT